VAYSPRSTVTAEPLTYERVQRASRATAALFHWCTVTLKVATAPEPEPEEIKQSPPPSPKPPSPKPQPLTPPKEEAEEAGTEGCATQPGMIVAENKMWVPLPEAAKQSRPAPPLLPPVKQAAPPSPKKVLSETEKPDRHFEAVVCFERGYGNLADQSMPMLQTVAAILCMRGTLCVELVGCPDRIEHTATNSARLRSVMEFFEKEGLEALPASEKTRTAKEGEPPAVVCKILLIKDRELRDFFLLREQGELLHVSAHTKCLIQDMEDDFSTCMAS